MFVDFDCVGCGFGVGGGQFVWCGLYCGVVWVGYFGSYLYFWYGGVVVVGVVDIVELI